MDKKQLKKYIAWVCLAALVILLAVMPLLAGTEEAEEGPQASILSGTAGYASIRKQLLGGGTLSSRNAAELTVPVSVKVSEYLVANGDTVSRGDVIAYVDRVSLMDAIVQVQDTLDTLSEKIEEAGSEDTANVVTAQAGGRVKQVYAQPGDDVQDVMLEHGALAVLSLDDLMTVKISRSTELEAGDTVCVTLDDGTETEGTVESNLEGVLTVTVEDENYPVGQNVTVYTEDGDRIGSGELDIHSRWNAVAYSGVVSYVNAAEGRSAYAGQTLMRLTDTGSTAEYTQLVAQHKEYEALLFDLFKISQSEAVLAPCDGVVTGVDTNAVWMLANNGGWKLDMLTETEEAAAYTGYVAHVKAVGTDGLILKVNPTQFQITDLADPGVSTDTAAMSEDYILPGTVTTYTWTEDAWVESGAAEAGDILLFVADAEGITWVVKLGYEEVDAQPEPPSEPEEPTDPTQPETPGEPSQGTQTPGGNSSIQIPSGMGQAGMSGYTDLIPEEDESLFSQETYTIACVTEQEEMSLEITIDELDISWVYVGQTAQITVPALPGEAFTAVVSSIGSSGTNEGGNSKFTVELMLDMGEHMLPGMNASAYITLDTLENVLSIPAAALNESGTHTYVYTSYDEENGVLGDPVEVTVGVSDGENVQILSGLEEGQAFYYAYYDTLEISNIPDAGMFPFG